MDAANVAIIRNFFDVVIARSYVPREYFKGSDEIIESAAEDFMPDYLRWFPDAGSFDFDRLMMTPQLVAMLCYRAARKIFTTPSLPHAEHAADAYSLLGREIAQMEIFYSADIGAALKINHGLGTVIGARCKIGDRCMIHQNCTLGDRDGGRPRIGNDVVIYAGSMVLGDISIGDHSVIGANSVVLDSCPPGSVLVGSPAKIVNNI